MKNRIFSLPAVLVSSFRDRNFKRARILGYVFVLLFLDIRLYAQPCEEPAEFTFTTPYVCSPCTFQFEPEHDQGSHLWDFGDGTTSTELNPQHTYSISGTFMVTHTVKTPEQGGGYSINECKQMVEANCSEGIQLLEYVRCCELVLEANACAVENNSCTNHWEVLNDQGVVCMTSTEPSPVFVLRNMDTYLHTQITVRHWMECNGAPTDYSEKVHIIEHPGIFANAAVGGSNLYTQIGLSSPLNGYKPLFPTNQVSNKEVFIAGVLNINSPTIVTFSNNQVCMAPDAGIDVQKHFLADNNSNFYNGCETAWRGFVVKENARLQLNDSWVSGAVYAIHPLVNSKLNLVGCRFLKNFISVFASANFQPSFINNYFGVGTPLPDLGATSIAEVVGETGNYSTERGFAGWYFSNASLQSGGYLTNNAFNDLANGIYLLNTSLNLDEVYVSNVTDDGVYNSDHSGHGVYLRHDAGSGIVNLENCFFDHAKYGIRIISERPGTKFSLTGTNQLGLDHYGVILEQRNNGYFLLGSVTNTTVDSDIVGIGFLYSGNGAASNVEIIDNFIHIRNGDGILLAGSNPGTENVKVLGNKIETSEYGGESAVHLLNFKGALIAENQQGISNHIDLSSFGTGSNYGIWLENSTQNVIRNNVIQLTNDGASPGIGLYANNSPKNTIESNITQSVSVGFKFTGDCRADNLFRCNTMANTAIGLQIGESPESPEGVIGMQSNTGNSWNDPGFAPGSGLIGAVNYGDLSQLQASLFETEQGSGSTEYPQSFELQSGLLPEQWFLQGYKVGCAPPPSANRMQDRQDDRDRAIRSLSIFRVYPNPASDMFGLWFTQPDGQQSDMTYAVFDSKGVQVLGGMVQAEGATFIETTGLPNGQYFCRISDAQGYVQTVKIAVQH